MKRIIRNILIKLNILFIIEFIMRFRFFHFRRHHPYLSIKYQTARSSGKTSVESEDVQRLVQSISKEIQMVPTAQWGEISVAYHQEALTHIKNKDYVAIEKMLTNPLTNNLMYGFDNLSKSLQSVFRLETTSECTVAADHFVALAEYVGVIKYISPEGLVYPRKKVINLNSVIDKTIEKVFQNCN